MFHPELTVGYSSDFNAKQPKHLILYNLLEEQMKTEEKLLDDIRVMEKEVVNSASSFLLVNISKFIFKF